MSSAAVDRKRELKKKLDDAKAKTKENAKSPKQKAKEKKEAEEQAKTDKAAQEEQAKTDRNIAAEKARSQAPVVPPDPGPWTVPGEELEEIGIHIGITCDGCGDGPPLIGRVFKCKTCADFDLCQNCYPLRLDRHRESVAAAAGMAGRGKHPTNHDFGARRAKVVMTAEAAGKEIVAAEQDKRRREQEDKARIERGEEKKPLISAAGRDVASILSAAKSLIGTSAAPWTPIPRLAKELPAPSGPPCEFGPGIRPGYS